MLLCVAARTEQRGAHERDHEERRGHAEAGERQAAAATGERPGLVGEPG